jgi:folate-dependent phosphoribosylglycinamide formyltransferase PurN
MLDRSSFSRLDALGQTARNQLPQLSDVGSTQDHLHAAINWLYQSQDVCESGGSSAGYNLILGWQDPYPETTGYIIPTLYRYAAQTGSEEEKKRATRMAEWLLSVQLSTGAFPGQPGSMGEPRVFNTGQILFGLTAAYQETERDEFKEAAVNAANWLVDVQNSDGSWSEYTYNRKAHTYHTRVAWSLLEVDSIESYDDYVEAARANYCWALNQQQSNGWFNNTGFEQGESPFLHTIAYTIRGLIEGGIILDDTELFEAGKETADILLERQVDRGMLKGRFDPNWNDSWYYCLPGNAQMVNIWLRLYEQTSKKQYLTTSSHTVQFLKRHQVAKASSNIRGGLPGSYPVVGRYMFLRYPNWGTKFLVDAFMLLMRANSNDNNRVDKNTQRENDVCRVCILFDGEYIMKWVAESIEIMLEETNADISLVVINDDSGFLSSGNLKRGMKYPAYYLFQLGLLLTHKVGSSSSFDDPVHISTISDIEEGSWIRTYSSKTEGLWNELPTDVVNRIGSTSDIIFRRGFGLIRGDILSATQYGVISYHHRDPRKYRGGPAGFWEFMNDESQAGVMIQSLTDELDAGKIQAYEEIDITNCESWASIRERLYERTTNLLSEAIVNIQDEDTEPEIIEDLGPVRHPPSTIELVEYLLKNLTE